ncbi:hypothetical protein M7I_0584 [Glarea lozoyensis 74030]|uniref:Uncharacterized protein n=1 Tax=Glarea lozoyensis (strain ATCC 74030 / MF5533) TaxID=1104152 RepID=H0EDX4_GLAL7|nr:hypothetical protein M7I_0584 [Glarea lozoyensis 74030]
MPDSKDAKPSGRVDRSFYHVKHSISQDCIAQLAALCNIRHHGPAKRMAYEQQRGMPAIGKRFRISAVNTANERPEEPAP